MRKLTPYIPNLSDLWYRKELTSDINTMSFNFKYGGIVNFDEDKWDSWYNKWVLSKTRYYAYLKNEDNVFVGEICYYLEDSKYKCSIIIDYKYRNKGYGNLGLNLLFEICKEKGIKELYDDIDIDNDIAMRLFLKNGFVIEYQTKEYIEVKKIL